MATGEEIRKFWAQTHAALSKVDMDAKVEPVESSDPFVMEGGIKTRTVSRVIMSSFEDRRIRAWYTLPSGHPPARGWPAILEVPGYGGIVPLPPWLVCPGCATSQWRPRSPPHHTWSCTITWRNTPSNAPRLWPHWPISIN